MVTFWIYADEYYLNFTLWCQCRRKMKQYGVFIPFCTNFMQSVHFALIVGIFYVISFCVDGMRPVLNDTHVV